MAEKKKKLKYENLWTAWLEAHDKGRGEGFEPIKIREGLKTYWLTPEDMMILMNAETPYDLYTKPSTKPGYKKLPYETSTLLLEPELGYETGVTPPVTAFATREPREWHIPLRSTQQTAETGYEDIPPSERRYVPQGIYEHELGHRTDPRIRPYAYYSEERLGPEVKQLMERGMPEWMASVEAPATMAEDRYWQERAAQYRIEREKRRER